MLDFLLQLHPTLLVIVVGVLISTVMVLTYKYMTDQDLMKRLKEEIKELQGEMKTLRSNPAKMAQVNKRAMETNMKYMMHSMKPTLITFIPIILIFGWLNGNVAFDPLTVGEEFSVELEFYESIAGEIVPITTEGMTTINGESYTIKDNKVRIVHKADAPGSYELGYKLVNDVGDEVKVWQKAVLVAQAGDRGYEEPVSVVKDEILMSIAVSNDKFTPFGDNFNIFGWRPGWLALYIIVSLVCSIGLRKVLNVY